MRKKRPEQHRPYRIPGGIFIPVIGVVASFFMFLLTLYQPYVNAKGSFPLEWVFLLVWATLGILFWFIARKIRAQVSEPERRRLIFRASITLDQTTEVENTNSLK